MQNKTRFILIIILIISVLTGNGIEQCYAIDNFEQVTQELNKSEPMVTSNESVFLNFIKLFCVLAVIILFTWIILKLFSHQVRNKIQGRWIQVIDEIVLGQNKGIVLCKINQQLYALGITDHQINLLFEIDDLELIKLINETEKVPDHNYSFKPKLFKSVLNKNNLQDKQVKQDFHLLMQAQINKIKNMSLSSLSGQKEKNDEK